MAEENIVNKITVLDGGLATELEKHGAVISDELWSARILHTDPSLIVKVHKSYLENGADVITTSSYQASLPGFEKHLKLTQAEAIELIKKSVLLAKQARDEYLEKDHNKDKKDFRIPLIAGSVGPYGACQADGSEYTGNYCDQMSHEELIAWHRPRFQYLVEAGVDLIAMETVPAAKEGEALLKLLAEFSGVKAWLSFSCQSLKQTAHGEDFSTVVKNCTMLAPANQLLAIGVNCCPPHYVSSLLDCAKNALSGYPLICYPNSGEKWVSKIGWTKNKEKPIYSYADSWIKASAKWIGGCCRTSPEDIAEISKLVQKISSKDR